MEKKVFTKDMKMVAQGDMMIVRMEGDLPENIKEISPSEGKHVVAHSETGHHHYLLGVEGVKYFGDPSDNMTCYLSISTEAADLIHDRSYDTHQTISLTPGNYKLRRQREYTPEGLRRVED